MILKWLAQKQRDRVVKRYNEKVLSDMRDENIRLFSIMDNMLRLQDKCFVFKADTEDSLSVQWETFREPKESTGRLGHVYSIEDKRLSIDKGSYHLVVFCRMFTLKPEYGEDEFREAVRAYEAQYDKLNDFEKALNKAS